jgi:hypothetical protein
MSAGRVRPALLAVEPGDERGVEMLGSRVRQFVDHPCPRHAAIPLRGVAP